MQQTLVAVKRAEVLTKYPSGQILHEKTMTKAFVKRLEPVSQMSEHDLHAAEPDRAKEVSRVKFVADSPRRNQCSQANSRSTTGRRR